MVSYSEFLEGKSSLTYEEPGFVMALCFYKDNKTHYGPDLQGLIGGSDALSLKDDEFLYGTRIAPSYWSCRWDSIFTQPCPLPPSKPHL